MSQVGNWTASAALFVVAIFLFSSSTVNGRVYQTTDTVVIEAGDIADEEELFQSTHLLSNAFMKIKERTCLTREGNIGFCTSIRSCHPRLNKFHHFNHFESRTFAIRGACIYHREDDRQVYGICCPTIGNYDFENDDQHQFYSPFPSMPVNPYIGLPYGTSHVHSWLQNPHTRPLDTKTTALNDDYYDDDDWKEEFIDPVRQQAVCGAGPGRNLYSEDGQRIVGGSDANPNSWPFMAALRFSGKFLCGGSLISPNHVLTAAHCVSALFGLRNRLTVDLGMHNLRTGDAQVTKKVRRIRVFWGFNFRTKFNNDIAILTLTERVTYTSTISPVCLPPLTGTRELYENEDATVIGWGSLDFSGSPSPTVLQEANVKVTPNSYCKDNYKAAGYQIMDNTMICAAAAGKDACRGDSGGPLIYRSKTGSWTQIGIVSFGIDCAHEKYPGVFTRVATFRQWIRRMARV